MNTLTYMFIIITLCISCWEVGADATFNEMHPATDLPLPSDASGQVLAANGKYGAYFTLSAKGIQEFATSIINAQPSNCTTFRGFRARVNVASVGNVNFRIGNFKLLEKIGGSVTVTVVDGVGLKVVAKDTKLKLSSKWAYSGSSIADSGIATIEASDMQMEFMLTFMETSSRFTTRECSGSFSKLEVNSEEVSGRDYAKKHFSDIFSNPCRLLRLILEKVSGTLKELSVTKSIDTDFSITKAPLFSDGNVGLFMKGEFYPAGRLPTSPFNPSNMNPDNDDKLFNLLLSTETIKSIFKGLFPMRITKEDIPDEKDWLRIECWYICIGKNFLFMTLNWSGYYVEFEAYLNPLLTATPLSVELKNDGIHVTFNTLYFHLIAVEGSNSYLMKTYDVTFTILVKPRLENGRTLKWTAEKISFRTERGYDFYTSMVNIAGTIYDKVFPFINTKGSTGVELPPNLCLKLLNSELNVENGKLQLGGDMRYSG